MRPRGSRKRHGFAHSHAPGEGERSSHPESSTATTRHRWRLILALAITVIVIGVQLVGALISGSLALLADTGHLLSDATGIVIALVASLIAARPASPKRTYGYLRVEVLAALMNGVVLGVIAVVIFVEAIRRFGQEFEIATGPMLIAAGVGALANLASLLILRAGQRESLNIRGAYLEVFGDLLGSIAVIAAGIVIMLTDWNWVDPLASIVIALMILPRAVSLLREVVDVLLEAAPRGFDVEAVRAHMLTVPGVLEVHDVHAWLLTSGVPAFSAHITVASGSLERAQDRLDGGAGGAGVRGAGVRGEFGGGVRGEHGDAAGEGTVGGAAGEGGVAAGDGAAGDGEYHAILDELKACLREHFDVDHTTLQLEPEGHRRPGPHRHD